MIDDLHLAAELPALRPPPTARLVLLTRQPPTPAILRWAGDVPVEVGPGRLALSKQRTIRLLHQRHGIAEPEATHVHQLTAGWRPWCCWPVRRWPTAASDPISWPCRATPSRSTSAPRCWLPCRRSPGAW
ncbi:hypothetical protein ACFQY4_34920 [Catellatospora bangladeshensis]|uniref:hypothetical protein n=1 Tax=Catellatospora bangladeshensis TaxID=310355 RepID=UPI0036093437